MGRRKTFDDDSVLDAATALFWQRGFGGTSYHLLEQHTRLSGRSLINAFGDKEALFSRALHHYRAEVSREIEGLGPPSAKSLLAFFRGIEQSPADSLRNRGCLLVNSLAERDALSPEAQAAVADFKQCLLDFFAAALRAENIAGADAKAEFLLSLLWGLSAQIRASATVKAVTPTLKVLQETLKSWRAAAG